MKIGMVCLLSLLLWGCENGSSSNDTPIVMEDTGSGNQQVNIDESESENIIVFIFKGNTQCNDDGISQEESSLSLTNTGIDVLSTQCGLMTGVSNASVCGGATNNIIAHEIRNVSLPDANEIGYEAVETLINEETGMGYVLGECEND